MPAEGNLGAASVERESLIRAELQKIFASDAFKGGKRAQDFLELVVEHALAGRFDNLRERMLGAEMFRRPVDYDTANDAVVRVKASEVRRRLAEYYRSLETPPPIRIDLPTGSYVPQFSHPPKIENIEEPAGEAPIPPVPPRRLWMGLSKWQLATLCTIVVAGALAGGVLWNRRGVPEPIRSIAVLPLANYSGDPKEDYFADGMTESLIAELGQISSLRVISRTSSMTYKGTKETIPEIAHELSVGAIVEGSVEREGNRVRITIQLIDARKDQHLWAHTYDRDLTDVFALQSEVAQAISNHIRAELTPTESARLNHPQHVNPEAMDLYLRGMERFNGKDPKNAIAFLQQAIAKAPDFAAAHVGLAKAYGWAGEAGRMPYGEAFSKQQEEAAKAIQLGDTSPEPHLELAHAALERNLDWATCEREIQRALAINPNSTAARWMNADYLMRTGQEDEAINEATIASQLDPVSASSFTNRAFIKYFARHYDAALDDMKQAAKLPHDPKQLDFALADIYVEKGRYKEAADLFAGFTGPHALGHLGNIYAREGKVREAQAIIEEMKQEIEKTGIGRYEIALIYAGLGDKDNAFKWLQVAFQTRDKGITFIKADPCLDPLRSDPRFNNLIAQVGFPS